jgi:hypothetical protein
MSDFEEREFEREEACERDLDARDIEEILADEARDDLEVTLASTIPVICVVNGHEFEMYRGLTFCRKCGQDRDDELNQPRVWL